MTAQLLPDDAHAAEQIVRLTNANATLRHALRTAVTERDYWRARANAELAERQEREHEEDCDGR